MDKSKIIEYALKYPPPLVAAHWLREEAEELVTATYDGKEGRELDALLDALGIILLMLAFYEPGDRRRAMNVFDQAQRDRDRPSSHWNQTMRTLIDGLPYSQDAMRQSLDAYLARLDSLEKSSHLAELDGLIDQWVERAIGDERGSDADGGADE